MTGPSHHGVENEVKLGAIPEIGHWFRGTDP